MGGGRDTYSMESNLNLNYPPMEAPSQWNLVNYSNRKFSNPITSMVTNIFRSSPITPTTIVPEQNSTFSGPRRDCYRESRELKTELARSKSDGDELRNKLKTIKQESKLKDDHIIKLKEQYYKAAQDVKELNQCLDSAEEKAATSKRLLKKLEEEVNCLEMHKIKLEDSLAEMRSFSETKDTSDINTLVLGLQDLNTQVEDLAFEVFASCSPLLNNHLVTLNVVNYIRDFLSDVSTFRIAQDKLDCHMEENFIPLLQSLLHEALLKSVHMRFHGYLSNSENQVMEYIHSFLQESGKFFFVVWKD